LAEIQALICSKCVIFIQKLPKAGDSALQNRGVARLSCALGQKILLRSPSTKLTEFELKNRRKSAEEGKAEHLL